MTVLFIAIKYLQYKNRIFQQNINNNLLLILSYKTLFFFQNRHSSSTFNMWAMIFPVLLLGLATNSVSEVNRIELPINRTSQNATTLGLNENNSVNTSTTISRSDDDVKYWKLFSSGAKISDGTLSSSGQTFDENMFHKNGSSSGGITWDKVVNFLNSSTRFTLQADNVVEMIPTTNSSDACKKGLERYFDSLSKWETWAVKSK